jgi:hypothetical protein
MNNHNTEQCFKKSKGNGNGNGNSNSNSNNGNKDNQKKGQPAVREYDGLMPKNYVPSYSGDQPWCPICNSDDHVEATCPNRNAAAHLRVSKMFCVNCCHRGHTASDCKNPNPYQCKFCHKPGHKGEDCRGAARSLLESTGNKRYERLIWNGTDNSKFGKIQPAPGQAEQYALQQELAELERASQRGEDCEMLDSEELDKRLQYVAEKQIISWPGQQEPLHHIPLLNLRAKPVPTHYRPHKIVKSQGSSRSSVSSMAGTTNSSTTAWATTTTRSSNNQIAAALSKILNCNEPQAQAVYQRLIEEKTSASQRAVRQHLDKSTRLYRKQNYNRNIQALSLRIVESGALSDRMLQRVQFAMAQGTQFWRDPKAMEALVNRERPVCYKCGGEGSIRDGHMRWPDPEVACQNDGAAVLEIEDFEDWGVFIVFQCSCCNDGYGWVPRLPVVRDEEVPTPPNSSNPMSPA